MIDFAAEFRKKMTSTSPDFSVLGVLTKSGQVYQLGSDTKVLSTAFELIVRPLVFEIASEHGLVVYEPEMQNFYPDFTLMSNTEDQGKIAVDVKTTYRTIRKDGKWTASFTLGSYTSFVRTETKNITFPYSQFGKHYILGFAYTRLPIGNKQRIFDLSQIDKIECQITNVEYFVQEKHRIAGDRPGSGNTTNIGSVFGSSVDDFDRGNGPFAELGEDVFLDYWRNYSTSRDTRLYRNLPEYLAWRSHA